MSTNNEILSQRYHNYNYAPGVATYGIDGKTGEVGNDGNNIYYTDYTIKPDNESSRDLEELLEKITSGYMPIKNVNIPINRPYKAGDLENGDLFFDRDGIIYRLINKDFDKKQSINEATYTKYFKIVGQINIYEDQNFFDFSPNRLILNSKYTGYDIINTPGIDTSTIKRHIDTNSTVNIISSVVDENDNIEMVRMQSIDDVDIEDGQMTLYYKTTDNAYFIESNKPMVINGDLKVLSNNNLSNEFDDYSTVLTSDDTITYFKYLCDKLKYSIIYDDQTNRYSLAIYQEDKGKNILEYLINRNKTVFGKIYTAQNDQILVKLNDIIYDGNVIPNPDNYEPEKDITKRNTSIGKNSFSMYDFVQVDNVYCEESVNTKNKSRSLDVSLNVTIQDNIMAGSHNAEYYEQQLLSEVLGVKVSYIKNASMYDINDNGEIIGSNEDIRTSDIFAEDGRYKFTFNTHNIKLIDGKKSIKINILPLVKYSTGGPISYNIDLRDDNIELDDTIDGIYTLCFTISRTETNLGIHDIMIDRNVPCIYKSEYAPHIEILIPTNVDSIQKFALMHNTEVFIRYYSDIPYALDYQDNGKISE